MSEMGQRAHYRELPVGRELADRVECVWDRRDDDGSVLIVPDGCLDLIWLDSRELVLAGADRGPRSGPASPGRLTSGIRFRPGAAGSVIDLPAQEVVDQMVPADLLWPTAARRLTDELSAARPEDQLACLTRFVGSRPGSADRLVSEAALILSRGEDRVSTVAARLGLSERQLHRRTVRAVGYGPKMLSRVLRLRRLHTLAGPSLADMAQQAGYASQAHMSDDVRALTGMTPVRFLEYRGRRAALAWTP